MKALTIFTESVALKDISILSKIIKDNIDNQPDTKSQYKKAIELRLDYLPKISTIELKELANFVISIKQNSNIKLIFTLRNKTDGGKYLFCEKQRFEYIKLLARLNPDYFDIESSCNIDEIKKIFRKPKNAINSNSTKLICSYHNIKETPFNLDSIYKNMQNEIFEYYKIVTTAKSSLDCLKVLIFLKNNNQNNNLTCFCMGDLGKFSRVISIILNSPFCYFSQNHKTAAGQLKLFDLNLYNCFRLNKNSKVYALLGSPINKSIGHIFHNLAFNIKNINATYVKIELQKSEVNEFLKNISYLPFKGFSVTMPLKQIINQLDNQNPYNTINISNPSNDTITPQISYYNTDPNGALEAILERMPNLKHKKTLIFGSGGTAFSIAKILKNQEANITIWNKTRSKAISLATILKINYLNTNDIKLEEYDLIINTTPANPLNLINYKSNDQNHNIIGNNKTIVMDVNYNPITTEFLKQATNNTKIYGKEMFFKQALKQQDIWLSEIN